MLMRDKKCLKIKYSKDTNFDDISFSIMLSFYPDIDVVQNTVSFDENAHYTVTCDCSGSEAEIFSKSLFCQKSVLFSQNRYVCPF